MDFTLSVFVLIAGIFSLAVIYFLVLVLVLEPVINLILVGINVSARLDAFSNNGLNLFALHIVKQLHFHRSLALHQAQYGWFFIGLSAPASFTFQPKMLQRVR